MGLFSRLFSEFVDVIEWTDDSSNTMVSRFERYGNEIKYGAKLIVREAQFAVFVNEGEVADVLGPGTYELETKNLPILTTLQNWHHGFESPFKAEVYFCNARRFTDLKWGTKQPLMLRDSEFGGLRIRAFGTYGVRITDALLFIREIVGTEGVFTTDEISSQLRNLITSRFATIIGSSNIPVLDMAANYDQLGDFLTKRIAPEFGEYGLELTRILVENISLPPKVSEALDKRTSMGMTGNLDRYIQYQSGASMEAAAQNPGGGASDGIGMGIGLAMANQMSNNMQRSGGAGSPPPMPGSVATVYHVVIDGAARGPYTVELLMEHVASGSLKPDTLVWSPNLDQWQPANSVESLDSIWGAAYLTPPPIPKA
ncbi:MAG: membrane protease subunit (stomatin/prohibitin family) [Pseudomonadales bacterium]|jgi:membrane protease subunit (stomatin/prohibitin family)